MLHYICDIQEKPTAKEVKAKNIYLLCHPVASTGNPRKNAIAPVPSQAKCRGNV